MSIRHPGRRIAVALTVLAALGAIVGSSGSATAAPGEQGGENANKTLAQVLEETGRGWLDAKAKLDSSVQRQAELNTQLQRTEAELAITTEKVSSIAVAAYRAGGMSAASALLSSGTADGFMNRATTMDALARHNDRLLRQLNRLKKQLADSKAAIDAEVVTQQQQSALMQQQRREAERALAIAGPATNGWVYANSPIAAPAPRNANGSWPSQGCSIDDPTTGGCLTPRTLHTLQQAKAAGFTRYVSCWRGGDRWEHPKGRACDFAAATGGFGGVAAGDDRFYGNNLAAFFVRNAERLGVLYVIWFKQIWTPAAGWHRYGRAGGDPSSDHTNHVHVSLY